jgi:hypothetical protein
MVACCVLAAAIVLAQLPAQSVTVQVLRWVREHWLNAAAVSAVGAIAAALVPLVTWYLDDRRGGPGPWRRSRNRKVMLRRVRYKWITDVLESSLDDTPQLDLGLWRRPDVLRRETQATRHQGRPPGPLLAETSFLEVFDEVSGGLLILGGPGAGKTTLLLQLADELMRRAGRDRTHPIPVVADLTSWSAQRRPLATWLAEDIAANYRVPQPTVEAWIAQDELVLLLDGLDEIDERHRTDCVKAINGRLCRGSW